MFTMSPLDINPVFPGLWKVIIIIIIIVVVIVIVINIIEKNSLRSCKEK